MDRAHLSDRCLALPLFPLPGVVLMPGARMPLHVFEPRYRALVRDCLDSDGILAIPQILPEEEAQHLGRPGLYPYAGVGRIARHEELEGGRFNILVEPLGRVKITGEAASDAPYRVARAELLDDVPGDAERLRAVGGRLKGLFLPALARSGREGQGLAKQLGKLPAELLPEAVAPLLVRGGPERQAWLAENSAWKRANMVEAEVLALLAAAAAQGVAEA
jgi:Lon protease-like protein